MSLWIQHLTSTGKPGLKRLLLLLLRVNQEFLNGWWSIRRHLMLQKKLSCTAPVQGYPNFSREFILEIDASLNRLGTILSQQGKDGQICVIAYASHSLCPSKRSMHNYSSAKLELLALKWAVREKFRDFLLGSWFQVYRDNNLLTYVMESKVGASQIQWLSELALFNFVVKYQTGWSNRAADALSCHPFNPTCDNSFTESEANSEECEVISYSLVFEAVDICFNSTKIPEDLKQEVQNISCAIMEGEDMNEDKIVSSLNAVSTFKHVTPKQMAEEQQKDPTLKLVYQLVTTGEKPKTSAIAKIKSKAVRKCLLQFDRLTLKKGVLHWLYILNNVEFHQMVLPIEFQAQVLQMLHDGQGHQGNKRTIALCQDWFYWNTMFQDATKYVKECPRCQIAKGDYTEPNTILAVIIANNPMDLVCIGFTKVDPSKDGKENILVLTDAFTKFSQAFVTPNQKAITVAKILVDKWFYVYGIPAHIHSDKGHSFDNEIMSHLYTKYRVEQFTTMPYNLHGNAPTKRLNHTLIGLLKSLHKEQKSNWPLHLPSLVFAYNATPHDTTGYQPYELMIGHKAPTMCNAWPRLGNYNDNFFRASMHGLTNSTNSSLLWIGRH